MGAETQRPDGQPFIRARRLLTTKVGIYFTTSKFTKYLTCNILVKEKENLSRSGNYMPCCT